MQLIQGFLVSFPSGEMGGTTLNHGGLETVPIKPFVLKAWLASLSITGMWSMQSELCPGPLLSLFWPADGSWVGVSSPVSIQYTFSFLRLKGKRIKHRWRQNFSSYWSTYPRYLVIYESDYIILFFSHSSLQISFLPHPMYLCTMQPFVCLVFFFFQIF